MDEIDRLKLCIKLDNRQLKEIAEIAEMDPTRMTRTMNGKLRMSHKEFLALTDIYPEFKYWIIFGDELPEAGHISPMTKLAQKDYRAQEGG